MSDAIHDPRPGTDTNGPSVDGQSSMVVTERHGAVAAGEPNESILVVTWNIQFGVEVDAAASELAENERLAGADIVLVQEMDEIGVARLAEALGLDYVYAAPGIHQQSGRNFGNAVLARWQVGAPEVILLPHKSSVKGQERLLVGTEVTVGKRVIDVGSVHTEVPTLSSPKRHRQFDEVARAFAERVERPAILGGDFNTLTRRGINAVANRMAAVGATRMSDGAGTTLRRSGQEFTLDHVFARGFEPVATGVVHGSSASDHRPLWVELRMTETG